MDEELEFFTTNHGHYAKFILSARVFDKNRLLEKIEDKIKNKRNKLEVTAINSAFAEKILNNWLAKKQVLNEFQKSLLHKIMMRNSEITLFYVRMVFCFIKKWSSLTKPSIRFAQCFSSKDCLAYLYEKCSKKYGNSLFGKFIFYLSAFGNGIQDCEMENLIEKDEEQTFDDSAYPFSIITTWIRFKQDFSELLVDKHIDDFQVTDW